MIRFNGLMDDKNHIVTEERGVFSVIEHNRDLTVSPMTAMNEYFMSEMGVRRKQVLVKLDGETGVVLQTGAMQWMAGNVEATTGIKGAGDLLGKMFKGAATGESAVKPEYRGNGYLMLEPTYKYLLLEDVGDWSGGLVMEDGMFLACESTVKHSVEARSNLSSAVMGNEGLFNLKLCGNGVCALESNVTRDQIVEVELDNDVLKIDGSFAICWSGSLKFTVERSGKSLVGSAVSGEGLVNVYRGTGKVWLSTLDDASTLLSAGTPATVRSISRSK